MTLRTHAILELIFFFQTDPLCYIQKVIFKSDLLYNYKWDRYPNFIYYHPVVILFYLKNVCITISTQQHTYYYSRYLDTYLIFLNLLLGLFIVRADVPKGTADIFFRKVKFWKGDPPPVFVSNKYLYFIFRIQKYKIFGILYFADNDNNYYLFTINYDRIYSVYSFSILYISFIIFTFINYIYRILMV